MNVDVAVEKPSAQTQPQPSAEPARGPAADVLTDPLTGDGEGEAVQASKPLYPPRGALQPV